MVRGWEYRDREIPVTDAEGANSEEAHWSASPLQAVRLCEVFPFSIAPMIPHHDRSCGANWHFPNFSHFDMHPSK
jgi:hypothetical protein